MPESPPLERIADLVDCRISIAIHCACTNLRVGTPAYFMNRMGPEVTIDDAERRMICSTCQTRPRLELTFDWSGGIRDRRPNPPPIPDWAQARLADSEQLGPDLI